MSRVGALCLASSSSLSHYQGPQLPHHSDRGVFSSSFSRQMQQEGYELVGRTPLQELCQAPAFGCELPSSYEPVGPSLGVDFLE